MCMPPTVERAIETKFQTTDAYCKRLNFRGLKFSGIGPKQKI
ncbi:MAG: hypothetical protein PV344_04285 [Anaplasma sp.]|nr:hypothetical protein [Anaplasma sp.]